MNAHSVMSWVGLVDMYDDCVEILETNEVRPSAGQLSEHPNEHPQRPWSPPGPELRSEDYIEPDMTYKNSPLWNGDDYIEFVDQDEATEFSRQDIPAWIDVESWKDLLICLEGKSPTAVDNDGDVCMVLPDSDERSEHGSITTSSADYCTILESVEVEDLTGSDVEEGDETKTMTPSASNS
ncbi:hypothetical protein DL98DRAFT_591300 [Cadophora sp. DSE1049]|nr:hypothetical protein DL98DRAFT_591300 [Cadophora sp. DSE1049]